MHCKSFSEKVSANFLNLLTSSNLGLPQEFLDILENPEILKIGIGFPGNDQGRMKSQWNIEPKGLVDIRHVVRKFKPEAVAQKSGADHLAKEILGIKLDFKGHKDWKFHEMWESENLDENQIEYAANDVLTAMAIVLKGTCFSFIQHTPLQFAIVN